MRYRNPLIYVLLAFAIQLPVIWLPKSAIQVYVTVSALVTGLAAILFQKRLDGGTFADMGFRMGRNAYVGVGIAVIFSAALVVAHYWLPAALGYVEYRPAQHGDAAGIPPPMKLALVAIGLGALRFVERLFGQELAFRGYLLPKLEERAGPGPAVIACVLLFAAWQLPAYLSVHSGGTAEPGLRSVLVMVLARGLAAVPLCILYLTTRELYGVSLYHAILFVTHFAIVGSRAAGTGPGGVLYTAHVVNAPQMATLVWAWHIAAIVLMVGLCRAARQWALKPAS